MPPSTRLFGTDGGEIFGLPDWLVHAPPEGGLTQWKDGYSAKEQAKAWLRAGTPAVPEEWWSAISPLTGQVDEIYGRPEHLTPLDRYRGPRRHDMLACTRRNGTMVGVIGVEAKACEGFDVSVRDRAKASGRSRKRARCNLLARALFGCEVVDEDTGDIVDQRLADHGYQLWTATVGTIIEAQKRGVDQAIVVVHRFRPRDSTAPHPVGDKRQWQPALTATALAYEAFAADLAAAGSRSHETPFVEAGTGIQLIKVESFIDS